jgi:hypothetical protein
MLSAAMMKFVIMAEQFNIMKQRTLGITAGAKSFLRYRDNVQ